MLIFTKSRVAVKSLSKKGGGEQSSEYNYECMLFQYKTKDKEVI